MSLNSLGDVNSRPIVGFVIGTLDHGRGGHYWDLKTIAENLNGKATVIIFNIGIAPSPVLESSEVRVINVPLQLIDSIQTIAKEVKKRNIQSLFCIDIRVAIIAEIVAKKTQAPVIHIKPGGPNPSSTYPNLKKLIVYSKENYNHFKLLKKNQGTDLYFLPNRSEKVEVDELLVNELDELALNSPFKFVQVLRICKEYESNIYKALELIKRIELTGNKNVTLFVIGVVQDETVFKRILSMADNLPVHFITDSKYTQSASRLLSLGDAIIGNGRSVMEASSLGLPILVSACNSDIPILLDADSFEKAFEVNFSPRFELSEKEVQSGKSLSKILSLISDKNHLEQVAGYSLRSFETYFDINSVVDKYLEISTQAVYSKLSLLSLLKLFRFYLTSRLRVYKE